MLAQTVVQIMANPSLFPLARLQQFLFQPPAFLHLMRQRSRSLAHPLLQFLAQRKQVHHADIKHQHQRTVPGGDQRAGKNRTSGNIAAQPGYRTHDRNHNRKGSTHTPQGKNHGTK